LKKINPDIKSGCLNEEPDKRELPDEIIQATCAGYANFGVPGTKISAMVPERGKNEFITVGMVNNIQRKWLAHYQIYQDVNAAKNVFNSMDSKQVFGGVVHSIEGIDVASYYVFLEFLHSKDPQGKESKTVSEIIEQKLIPEKTIPEDLLKPGPSGVVTGGNISGTVLDQITGKPLTDASNGSIDLSVGWHKFVYRQQEREGGQASRAAFKAPGDTAYRWFSTSELEIRISRDHGVESGMLLINKKNIWSNFPQNHEEMVKCVDLDSIEESGWYGKRIVGIVNQDENIHGNDDYYTSYYEGYFYVKTAGTWYFSTDGDDASEICIDDQVIAYWYSGHGTANRWEHKMQINIYRYGTDEWIAGTCGNADGSYTVENLPSGRFSIEAVSPGYTIEWYDGTSDSSKAKPVVVGPSSNTGNIDFSLMKLR
jgi:hypothetical protein